MKIDKLSLLIDLEMMRLGLIPFSANFQNAIEDWPDDRKKKLYRKYRKVARKAAKQTAIREDRLYAKGSQTERKAWIKLRADYLFNPPSPKNWPEGIPTMDRQQLQQFRYGRRRSVILNWLIYKMHTSKN
jgi:hypothetical protein